MALHEYAQLFPPMTDAEYRELVEDIRRNGQKQPIITYEGSILDGAHRARACQELGIEPKAVEFEGDDPLALVISMNLARRHLTSSQRAILAQKLRPIYQAEADKARQEHGGTAPGRPQTPAATLQQVSTLTKRTAEQAAAALNTGVRYVYAAERLAKEAPDLHDAVRKGETNINQAMTTLTERAKAKEPASPKPRAKVLTPAFRPGTASYEQRKQKHARLFVHGFSLMEGTLAGAEHLDMQLVAEGLADNLTFWLTKLEHMARDLRAVHTKLKEHANV